VSDEPEQCVAPPAEHVDPSRIPWFTGNLGDLESVHGKITDDAEAIRGIGSDIHSRFQGLSAFYQAPEAEQLFATTTPVRDRADTFATDLESVGSALSSYADEIRPILDRLNTLRSEAEAFVAEIEADDEWQYDGDKVERNNQLLSDISTTIAEFWTAERTCANAITALVGGTQWTVDDGSGGENMYGMSPEDMAQAGETPWGQAVEEKHHWHEIGHHLRSFVWDGIIVDGIWGTIEGLATLVNPWNDNFAEAWRGLGQLATGLALLGGPVGWAVTAGSRLLPEDNPVRQWMDDSLDTTVQVGRSMVAWDEWSQNPARAAGLVTFNVVTTVATLGTGTAVRATGSAASATARAANVAARIGNAIDPMTYIGRGMSGISNTLRIGDITASLADMNAITATALPDGGFRLADGTTLPSNLTIDDLPLGASTLRLDDGTIVIPHNPDAALPGGVLDPETGNLLYPDNTIRDPQGNLIQHGDDSLTAFSAGDRALLEPDSSGLAPVGAQNMPAENLLGDPGRELPPPASSNAGNDLPPLGGGREIPDGFPANRETTAPGHNGTPGEPRAFDDRAAGDSPPAREFDDGGPGTVGDDVSEGSDIAHANDSAEGGPTDIDGQSSEPGHTLGEVTGDGTPARADWFDDRGTPTPRPQTHGLGADHPGFSMMNQSDPFYRNSRNVEPLEGHYDVVAHGDPHQAYMHAADGRRISPRDLANIIRNQADYVRGTPIRLLSCNTGHMDGTFARRLAQHLRTPVIAPDGYLYNNRLGQLGVSRELNRMLPPHRVPSLPDAFYRYHPSGMIERLERSEWTAD
jgi:hypothetical protein